MTHPHHKYNHPYDDHSAKPLSEYTPAEMRRKIWSLTPRNEIIAGIRFLDDVLRHRGVPAVLEYTKLAKTVIDEEGKLLEFDFTERGLKNYEKHLPTSRRSLFDRRDLLATWGCLLTGVAFGGWGLLKTGDQVAGYVVGKDEDEEEGKKALPKHPLRRFLTEGYKFIDEHAMGPAELLIGAVLIEECIKRWRESKLEDYEEMTNATVIMGDHIKADQKRFAAMKMEMERT